MEILSHAVLPEQLNKETMEDFKYVLLHVIPSLTKNTTWLGEFSLLHHFCWGVVNTCCSKISISSDDLSWTRNSGHINSLCEVFLYTCDVQKTPKLLVDAIPELIQQHTSKDLLRYVNCSWWSRDQSTLPKETLGSASLHQGICCQEVKDTPCFILPHYYWCPVNISLWAPTLIVLGCCAY